MPRIGLAVALGLVVCGSAALAGGAALDARGDVGLAVSDRPVNEGAGDLGDIRANNSPTVVASPRDAERLAVVNRIDTPRFSCAMHTSANGGRSWARTRIPIPPGEQPKCYAPDAAFTADGTLHVSYVTLRGRGNVPNAVWVASSRDGGRTLEPPRRVAGRLAFQVRIAADPRDPRRLYLSWLQARDVASLRFTGPGNPIVVAVSRDGGETWGRPVAAGSAERGRTLAPVPAVGPAGEVYVLYLDVGEDRLDYEGGHEGFGGPPFPGRFALVLSRSRDGGRSWEESVVDAGLRPIERFIAFIPAFPSIAVDQASGRVHVAFHDARAGDADVHLWTLESGSWRGPVRVNDTPPGDGRAQYLPRVAVAPGGRVDVVYYDRRDDPADRHNEVSLQWSDDGGATFSRRVRLSSRGFDSRIGFGSERDMPDLGSRLGLVSTDARALAVWSDTRRGTDASNKQDVHAAAISFAPDSGSLAAALTAAGGAAALAGLALLLTRRRRARVD